MPSENITLNPANKITYQNLSCFQTGIGATSHAILDMQQLIFHTRAALVDATATLQGSDGQVIAASEVHILFTKIHDILDKAVCKWVGNMACILTYLFNSVSWQHCEVWDFWFPFLHNIKNLILFSEAFLYGYINWSLAQAHQQSSLGLSQFSTCMRGARAKPKAGFCLM